MVSIHDCRLFDIPSVPDERGVLAFFDPGSGFPFAPARVFYLHSVPAGARRAGHAVRGCEQLITVVAGSCTLEVWDGKESRQFHLAGRNQGILVPPLVWRELSDFSADAVCLVLASRPYDENCYLRTKEAYIEATQPHG